jgi:hypothetical protein
VKGREFPKDGKRVESRQVCVCVCVCVCECVCVKERERDRQTETETERYRESWVLYVCMHVHTCMDLDA